MNSKNKCKTSNKLVLAVFIHGSEKKTAKKKKKRVEKRDKNVRKSVDFDPGGQQVHGPMEDNTRINF